MGDAGILIVGTGQAAYQLVSSLRDEGYAGPIRLVGDEVHLPYQRPPLSKAYLSGDVEAKALTFQADAYYAKHSVELIMGTRVARIDRAGRFVETGDGARLPYDHLVLAVGARNRQLPCAGDATEGIFGLRSLDDARSIRERLSGVRRAVVVGAGFLGLEFAAVAAAKGVAVSVVEASSSLMSRVVSTPVGNAFQAHHESLGVRFHLGTTVTSILREDGRIVGVQTADGQRIAADIVVASIGVIPNTELAQDAGLTVRNGILVDERLATDDPCISAIGDCATFPSRYSTGTCRLESIQNAVDQARFLAKRLTGHDTAFDAVPWFWSDQGGLKLQIAGLSGGVDEVVLRGDVAGRRFSAYCFSGGRLIAVESVARPADHMAARKLLAAIAPVTPDQVRDESLDLRTLLPQATPAA
jgi:3-phenylpropionate/trans-cinnamate dioxygenase ferredoxin reductase subunit